MSGHMTILKNNIPKPGKHDHVDFCISTGVIIRFNDPRRFGLITIATEKELELHKFFRAIGPDPLANNFNSIILTEALVGRKTSIKVALLDQRTVAGLGNIYVSESLFRSGISPLRLAHSLKRAEIERLTKCIREVLKEALEAGGSSLNDHIKPDGKLGYFQNKLKVYGKEDKICISCLEEKVKKIKQSGRSSFYCPLCQS
jgi:formamidopyrimidine-DNA glycosylase